MKPPPDGTDGDAYVGRSEFMLWAPKVMLVLAVLVYCTHWNHSIQFATVRVDLVGAFVLLGARRRFGYPLLDGILYQPGHQAMLRAEFLALGYDVT